MAAPVDVAFAVEIVGQRDLFGASPAQGTCPYFPNWSSSGYADGMPEYGCSTVSRIRAARAASEWLKRDSLGPSLNGLHSSCRAVVIVTPYAIAAKYFDQRHEGRIGQSSGISSSNPDWCSAGWLILTSLEFHLHF